VYGEVALGMTLALLISQCVFGPLTNGVARFYAPALERHDVGGYLEAARRLASSIAVAVAGLAVVLSVAARVLGMSGWIPMGLATLLFALLTGYNQLLSAIQNAARQRSIVALHQGIESWARIAFAALLVLLLGPTSTNAIVGYVVGIILVLASQYFFFQRIRGRVVLQSRATQPAAADWHGQILRYSWPFYTWSIFTWAQYSSDRWALGLYASAREVGLFTALFQLGNNPITMASTMVMQLLAPIFYQRAGDGTDAQRNARVGGLSWRLTLLVLALTGIAVAVTGLFHAQIFHLLVAEKYAVISPLLPYTLLAGGIFAASQLLELSLMSQMKTQLLIYAKITAALVGITLNFAGARRYGVGGVVAAGVVTWSFYFLWMVFLARSRRS
jgi:O-antigen/teichoic acid export membrane protein